MVKYLVIVILIGIWIFELVIGKIFGVMGWIDPGQDLAASISYVQVAMDHGIVDCNGDSGQNLAAL